MMSSRTTNARRRAVERAVKQSEIRRAQVDASIRARLIEKREAFIRSHTFSLDTGAPIMAHIGEGVAL